MSGAKGKTQHGLVNPLELGKEAVRSLGQQVAQETLQSTQDTARTFVEQLLGIDLKKADQAALAENQAQTSETVAATPKHIEIFDSAKHHGKSEQTPKPRIEAAFDYHRDIVKNGEKASKAQMHDMQQNIKQIKDELKRLIESTQMLKFEFAEVSVDQATPTVGNYHLNFLEWMLAVIRTAREKVEDSGAWLGAVKGKGAQKGYWGMFKKHGQMFGLSGERAVATQVG